MQKAESSIESRNVTHAGVQPMVREEAFLIKIDS